MYNKQVEYIIINSENVVMGFARMKTNRNKHLPIYTSKLQLSIKYTKYTKYTKSIQIKVIKSIQSIQTCNYLQSI